MECTLITKLAIMNLRGLAWMNAEKVTMVNRKRKRLHLNLRKLLAPSQKLALNGKLRNAFCTQAGLSAEAIDRIWQDAQGNE